MAPTTLAHLDSARYGLLGLPLAFVAMPLYVVLPQHYGQVLGVPLGLLGAVLLCTRLADAFIDPLLGRWVDRLLAHPLSARLAAGGAAAALAAGFWALFDPPVQGIWPLLGWCALTLVWTFLAYSLASVLHLAWGTRLGGSTEQRARVVAWREGAGLVGVVLANVLAVQAGLGWTTVVLALSLALGIGALLSGPAPWSRRLPTDDRADRSARPLPSPAIATAPRSGHAASASLSLPWRTEGFRRLVTLFLLNGIASAIPATLVLFFVNDRLQAPDWAPVCLAAYFLVGAASVPVWLRGMARVGPMRCWAIGMALATASFVGVLGLGPGDTTAFLLICLASGLALGADLTVPGTLLAGVVQGAGHGGRAEGAYAGWWQWATKLNLALAAGLALPALQVLGYVPGSREHEALWALTLAYGGGPCAIKLAALALCWRWRRHPALA